jgi:hypothetical protein
MRSPKPRVRHIESRLTWMRSPKPRVRHIESRLTWMRSPEPQVRHLVSRLTWMRLTSPVCAWSLTQRHEFTCVLLLYSSHIWKYFQRPSLLAVKDSSEMCVCVFSFIRQTETWISKSWWSGSRPSTSASRPSTSASRLWKSGWKRGSRPLTSASTKCSSLWAYSIGSQRCLARYKVRRALCVWTC